MTKELSLEDFIIGFALPRLKEGKDVKLPVSGVSMQPTLRDGKDEVIISAVNRPLKVGDVVLFHRHDGAICLHRIIEIQYKTFVIRGDGNSPKSLEHAYSEDIFGVLTSGTMFGGKPFDIDSLMWKKQTDKVLKHFEAIWLGNRTARIFLNYWPSMLVTALVLYLSFFNPESLRIEVGQNIPYFDKIVHFLMYAAVSFTFWFDYIRSHRHTFSLKRAAIYCCVFPFLVGGFIEIAQGTLTDYRGADLWDFVADTAGVVVSTVLALALMHPFFEKHPRFYNNVKKTLRIDRQSAVHGPSDCGSKG